MDAPATATKPMEQVLYEVKKVIVGQDTLLERLIVALLARGHVLVEGVPGLAKTMAIKTLASAIGGEFQRIQFTPDLVPADLVGTRIYNQQTGEFHDLARPGVHEPAARRRDQPRAGQGAERAARGDAGAPGDHRPRDAPRARPVPRAGDPEPDRVRGHLPAARGAGRPLHAQGARRLPDADRGVRDRRAHDGRARAVRTRRHRPSSSSRSSSAADAVYVDPALMEYAVRLVGATRDPAGGRASATVAATALRREPARRRST